MSQLNKSVIFPNLQVKRVRKRAKLLPLIKKYKKKKKKKVDGVDQLDETKLDHKESVPLKVLVIFLLINDVGPPLNYIVCSTHS